jgi:hypothetical protein
MRWEIQTRNSHFGANAKILKTKLPHTLSSEEAKQKIKIARE